jgi:hypothetical protein
LLSIWLSVAVEAEVQTLAVAVGQVDYLLDMQV